MNMNDDFTYYSEQGERLKIMYRLHDFLNNPNTKNILLKEWNESFRKTVEEPLIELIQKETELQSNIGTELFRQDRGGQFMGELISELFYHVKPKYDLEIFYNNPELAKNLVNN